MLERQYKMNWLPNRKFELYVKKVFCLVKNKKAKRALPLLYEGLRQFAITFYQLRNFHLYSDIDSALVMIRRNEIIDGMHNEVLRVNITTYY